ncbi:MAG: hypothetical protein ABI395_10415, partial [Sphingobium sp.]
MGTWLTASGKAQVRIAPCPDPANGPIYGLVVGPAAFSESSGDSTCLENAVKQDWPPLTGRPFRLCG